MQPFKEKIKYLSRKYFGYDLNLRKIKIEADFLDQKNLLCQRNRKSTDRKIIFDVGSNIGQTSQKYRKIFPSASIYAFEPFAETFEKYKQNMRGDANIYPQLIALSDKKGAASFFTNECNYTNSLLTVMPEYATDENCRPSMQIQVETDTLNNFCISHKIDHIDILKLDVQGGELLVLKGAEKMLEEGLIDIIYTEVEFVPIYMGQPLFSDIKTFLESHNYSFYKTYNQVFSEGNVLLTGDSIFIRNLGQKPQ